MAYIGKAPTPAQLTTDGITNDTITTAKLADASVTAAKVNGLTSSIAELNSVDGITADSADLNRLGVTTLGTAEASKVVTTDASNNVTVSGDITAGTLLGDGSQISNLPPTGGAHTATADGAISDGDTCVVNSNGTVSKIVQNFTPTNPQTLGTAVTVSTGGGVYNSATATNGSDTVLHVFAGTSSYVSVIAGTVGSGNATPSYGTEVTVQSEYGKAASVVYIGSNKWVIGFAAGTNTIGLRVATVSGTTVTLGTLRAYWGYGNVIRLAYDTNENQFLAIYRNTSSSNRLDGVIFTVSGTTITLSTGDITTIESSAVSDGYQPMGVTYDTNADRFVVAYETSSQLKARVINNVNKSLTIGSQTTVSTRDVGGSSTDVAYDNSSQKHLIVYNDDVNSPYNGYGKVATVDPSNNSISFGTETAITTGNDAMFDVGLGTDATHAKILIAYRVFVQGSGAEDGYVNTLTISGTTPSVATAVLYQSGDTRGNSIGSFGDGRAVVFGHPTNWISRTTTYSTLSANLTAENFIGISNGAYADGATATIQTAGVVDDAQSGLTAGQSYFVQGDGTLGLTADSPSVFAGTAVSATEIIVQG